MTKYKNFEVTWRDENGNATGSPVRYAAENLFQVIGFLARDGVRSNAEGLTIRLDQVNEDEPNEPAA